MLCRFPFDKDVVAISGIDANCNRRRQGQQADLDDRDNDDLSSSCNSTVIAEVVVPRPHRPRQDDNAGQYRKKGRSRENSNRSTPADLKVVVIGASMA